MRSLALLLLALVLAPPALADDGRIEINQASIDAAGGFPLTISSPGNFLLTSDLAVPADTQAILIRTTGVSLDLRGFEIAGPFACSVAGCATGFVNGIGVDFALGGGRRSTVRGGSVRGFSGTCLTVGSDSYVTEMSISSCGNNGIQGSAGSLLRANRIHDTGREGIVLAGEESGYVHNVIRASGLALDTPSIRGGTSLGGNVCRDGGCSSRGRRFYLSKFERTGATAPSACVDGFHMASLPELVGSDWLDYDSDLGQTTGDSGSGPPALITFSGWIRSGEFASSINCSGFTSTSGTGPNAFLHINLTEDIPFLERADREVRLFVDADCSGSSPVWCVED